MTKQHAYQQHERAYFIQMGPDLLLPLVQRKLIHEERVSLPLCVLLPGLLRGAIANRYTSSGVPRNMRSPSRTTLWSSAIKTRITTGPFYSFRVRRPYY